MFAAPQQLELLLRLADKVDFSLLRSLWLTGCRSCFWPEQSFTCTQDISSGVLVSENTNSLQKKLWTCMCDLAGDPAWERQVHFMFM